MGGGLRGHVRPVGAGARSVKFNDLVIEQKPYAQPAALEPLQATSSLH